MSRRVRRRWPDGPLAALRVERHAKASRDLSAKARVGSASPDTPDCSHRTSVARNSRKSVRPALECVPDRYRAVGLIAAALPTSRRRSKR
jgi:hypothetical protein